MSTRKVAFITGASRGIGALTAIRLAKAGYDLALTARTVDSGEAQPYAGEKPLSLPGSLKETAAAAEQAGARVLTIKSDILDTPSVLAAAQQTVSELGRVDVLFNNACYQGPGNMQRLLEVTDEQVVNIYRGNVLTPLALVQALLPGMLERGSGAIVNMVSGSALQDPPAPADQGGWGFAYPSSKAALIRMVPSLRAEHKDAGVSFWNVEPGFVLTEVMRANGFDDAIAERFRPTPPEHIAEVVHWLVESAEASAYADKTVIMAPQLYRKVLAGD